MDNILQLVDDLKDQTQSLLGEIAKSQPTEVLHESALKVLLGIVDLKSQILLVENMGEQKSSKAIRNSNKHDESNNVSEEINKVARKLPRWAKNQNQINSKILTLFLELKRSGKTKISEDSLAKAYGNTPEFHRNFPQMKSIAPNNHGKVFETANGFIEIWKPVIDLVHEYESQVFLRL